MPRAPSGSKRQGLITAPESPGVELAALEQACQELAHCDCPETVKSFLDRAEALRHFARNAKMGLDLVNKAAEVKIRAERRLGQLLTEMNLHGGDRVSDSHHLRGTLKELNISRVQSSRFQKMAEVPEEVFCKLVEAAREHQFELTSAAVLRLATALRKKRPVNGRPASDSRKKRSSARRPTASLPTEIIADLENHCAVFDGVLSSVYDAVGPVDLHSGEKKYLRRTVREFRSLLDDLKKLATSQKDQQQC